MEIEKEKSLNSPETKRKQQAAERKERLASWMEKQLEREKAETDQREERRSQNFVRQNRRRELKIRTKHNKQEDYKIRGQLGETHLPRFKTYVKKIPKSHAIRISDWDYDDAKMKRVPWHKVQRK